MDHQPAPDTPSQHPISEEKPMDKKARRKALIESLPPYSKERFYERLRMPLPVLDAVIALLIIAMVVVLLLGLR